MNIKGNLIGIKTNNFEIVKKVIVAGYPLCKVGNRYTKLYIDNDSVVGEELIKITFFKKPIKIK